MNTYWRILLHRFHEKRYDLLNLELFFKSVNNFDEATQELNLLLLIFVVYVLEVPDCFKQRVLKPLS